MRNPELNPKHQLLYPYRLPSIELLYSQHSVTVNQRCLVRSSNQDSTNWIVNWMCELRPKSGNECRHFVAYGVPYLAQEL